MSRLRNYWVLNRLIDPTKQAGAMISLNFKFKICDTQQGALVLLCPFLTPLFAPPLEMYPLLMHLL